MTAPTRHLAGHATFAGDQRHIVGEVKGPTTYGSVVVAASAEFDAEANRTRVEFHHLAPADLEVLAELVQS